MPEAKPADARHEPSDLQPRIIAIFGIALIATLVACVILAVWLFDFFAANRARQDRPRPPVARVEAPPEPHLQVAAPQDLEALRKQEDSVLESYGWVDRGAGIVRIPIDRAMELLADRGLSTTPEESIPLRGTRTGPRSQAPKGTRK